MSRLVPVTVDGVDVALGEGGSILDACRLAGRPLPTLCYGETLTPANACRICMVELDGSRVLVPACSRRAEPGMVVKTDSDRARTARRLVLELLGSAVDLSLAPHVEEWMTEYGADPHRFGPPATDGPPRRSGRPGEHAPSGGATATVGQAPLVDNELYVRDYARCILCYKCVDACGEQAQNTFAIAVAGRGFDARISTEQAVPLPESACVYCGNCIGVCPTGALMFKSEYDMREAGTWDESAQVRTDTICPYCGVGCALTLHAQDDRIVKVTSPSDSSVTDGHLCIKGRFGFEFVNNRPGSQPPES